MNLRSSEEIAKLTQERRLKREEKKDKKKLKEKFPGNPNWKPNMPSPNPSGRPKGVKNKFSKKIRQQLRRVFEQQLYQMEIDSEKYTPNQRLKVLEIVGKYVLEEKKTIKKEVNQIKSIQVTFKQDLGIEGGSKYAIENTEEIDYEDQNDDEDYE